VWIPDALFDAAKRSEKVGFYCSYGHPLVFMEGESDLDKMRRERDRLAQQLAQRDDRIREEREARETAERRAAAARGLVTKIKNRVGHGVCPCCNRTFSDLARHMAGKHPGYVAEAAE
jgi:phage/plasmid primase-like uncharacterized protein